MGGRGQGFDRPRDRSKWSNSPMSQEFLPRETLNEAIGRKSAPMSLKAAYSGANPYYDETHTHREFIVNCQRCIVANELRRRGYNVEALPSYKGDEMGLVRFTKGGTLRQGNWTQAFRGARPISVGTTKKSESPMGNIEKKMQEFGKGSRAVVSVGWKGGNGSGHVFSVENVNGKITYTDAQTGRLINAADYFKSARSKDVTLTRTDNLKISDRAKKFVKQKRKVDRV